MNAYYVHVHVYNMYVCDSCIANKPVLIVRFHVKVLHMQVVLATHIRTYVCMLTNVCSMYIHTYILYVKCVKLYLHTYCMYE